MLLNNYERVTLFILREITLFYVG